MLFGKMILLDLVSPSFTLKHRKLLSNSRNPPQHSPTIPSACCTCFHVRETVCKTAVYFDPTIQGGETPSERVCMYSVSPKNMIINCTKANMIHTQTLALIISRQCPHPTIFNCHIIYI